MFLYLSRNRTLLILTEYDPAACSPVVKAWKIMASIFAAGGLRIFLCPTLTTAKYVFLMRGFICRLDVVWAQGDS